jgi:prolyl 4-hydroxylase
MDNRFELTSIHGFLDFDQCEALCNLIDRYAVLRPSGENWENFCTATRAPLSQLGLEGVTSLEARVARAVGVKAEYCEGLQGQVYREGEYYGEHWDAFHAGTPEFDKYWSRGGQRTWTAMIYLSSVEQGGQTVFPVLRIAITPQPGLLLLWYNQARDGVPHPQACHSSAPVIKGRKYVITAWFRERPYLE